MTYTNYTFPNTPFVFDKIYQEAKWVSDKGLCDMESKPLATDEVFVTRYIFVNEYFNDEWKENNPEENKEYCVVFQKTLDSKSNPYYKRIAALDYSAKANEQIKDIKDSYWGKNGGPGNSIDGSLYNQLDEGAQNAATINSALESATIVTDAAQSITTAATNATIAATNATIAATNATSAASTLENLLGSYGSSETGPILIWKDLDP